MEVYQKISSHIKNKYMCKEIKKYFYNELHYLLEKNIIFLLFLILHLLIYISKQLLMN